MPARQSPNQNHLLAALPAAEFERLAPHLEPVETMLGVRREGVTEAAGKLQQAGVVRYRRGYITVLDRSGLESQACECYEVVMSEFARLLPDVLQRQDISLQSQNMQREALVQTTDRSRGRQ